MPSILQSFTPPPSKLFKDDGQRESLQSVDLGGSAPGRSYRRVVWKPDLRCYQVALPDRLRPAPGFMDPSLIKPAQG